MEEQSARKTILVLLSVMIFFFGVFLVTAWLMYKLAFEDLISGSPASGEKTWHTAGQHLEPHAIGGG